ncbi:MAG: chorismate mutase [Elusimicrobia bacterium]|nr:chorismate mutase [Elusimicrobiota bacterium]
MKKPAPKDRLAALRRRVDAVDRRIVRLLAARQRLVAAMTPFKTRLRDPRREAQVLADAAREARRAGLDGTFARSVYRDLLGASRSFLKRRA